MLYIKPYIGHPKNFKVSNFKLKPLTLNRNFTQRTWFVHFVIVEINIWAIFLVPIDSSENDDSNGT